VTASLLKYNFIAIEGNIGAGKTTLASRLSEPEIFAFPLEMSFLADRYQQLKEKLSTQELFSTFTISDYFIDKSLIFAKNNLKADEFGLYSRLFQIISTFLPRPDLLVYLYLDIPRLQKNINQRGREYERLIQDDYLEKIQAGYLNHFRSLSGLRILIIDTNKVDFVENEKDYQAFLEIIGADYDVGVHRIFI
jgi:deoxyguanosine kinase